MCLRWRECHTVCVMSHAHSMVTLLSQYLMLRPGCGCRGLLACLWDACTHGRYSTWKGCTCDVRSVPMDAQRNMLNTTLFSLQQLLMSTGRSVMYADECNAMQCNAMQINTRPCNDAVVHPCNAMECDTMQCSYSARHAMHK